MQAEALRGYGAPGPAVRGRPGAPDELARALAARDEDLLTLEAAAAGIRLLGDHLGRLVRPTSSGITADRMLRRCGAPICRGRHPPAPRGGARSWKCSPVR